MNPIREIKDVLFHNMNIAKNAFDLAQIAFEFSIEGLEADTNFEMCLSSVQHDQIEKTRKTYENAKRIYEYFKKITDIEVESMLNWLEK